MSVMDKIKNRLQMGKGRGKEGAGRTIGNPRVTSHGRRERAEGAVKQAGEHLKDVGKNIREGFKR